MVFKQALMIVICIFFVIGIIDFYRGSKWGVGKQFEYSFSLMGRIILAVVGMICLSPVLSEVLRPVISPVFSFIGADPAMFASIILAPDSGAFVISANLAQNVEVGKWAGTVVAAHYGSAFSFNIPVSLGVIPKRFHRTFSMGALSGLIASPVGCILGGLVTGLPIQLILINLVPALVISLVVILGLYFIPEKFMGGFVVFGRLITAVILCALTAATIERLTGFALIPGMKPIGEGLLIAGTVSLTMAGILCMTQLVSQVFKKQLISLSSRLKLNETSILYLMNSMATIMPGAMVYEKMNYKGRVLYAAIAISAANILGAHLGYIGTTIPEMLMPTVIGKIASGVVAVVVALIFMKRIDGEKYEEVNYGN